jgi:Protein of unknown function (DUF2934)
MSERNSKGSQHEEHHRAPATHPTSAHAHLTATVAREKQDHLTGSEASRQAMERPRMAHQRSEAERRMSAEADGDSDIAELAHQLWVARGCPEGSPEVDWHLASQQLGLPFSQK